jgi:hypothetical protein
MDYVHVFKNQRKWKWLIYLEYIYTTCIKVGILDWMPWSYTFLFFGGPTFGFKVTYISFVHDSPTQVEPTWNMVLDKNWMQDMQGIQRGCNMAWLFVHCTVQTYLHQLIACLHSLVWATNKRSLPSKVTFCSKLTSDSRWMLSVLVGTIHWWRALVGVGRLHD